MNDVPTPFSRDLTIPTVASLAIALVLAGTSLSGVVAQTRIYPAAQVVFAVGTDAINLIVVLPLLLGSLWLARRGSLIGLLLWPGTLLYTIYIYTFNLIAVPFNALFLAYLVLVAVSVYTLIALMAGIQGEPVRRRLNGRVPARVVGGILAGLAILFVARTAVTVIAALANHTVVGQAEIAPWISDFVVECPALLISGVLLWRREALGYAAGAGLLLEIGVLFTAVPISAVLGALLTGSPVDTSTLVFLVLGAIPLGLLGFFARGAVAAGPQLTA